MSLNWTELALDGRRPLNFRGRQIALAERREDQNIDNSLRLRFDSGVELVLESAVDVSQTIDLPRIFVIEGLASEKLMIFGGEKAYWILADGRLFGEYLTNRASDLTKYWSTRFVQIDDGLIVIYETSVLALDQLLEVRWHTRKYINDFFASVANGSLKFLRDHDLEWSMQISDGTPSLGL